MHEKVNVFFLIQNKDARKGQIFILFFLLYVCLFLFFLPSLLLLQQHFASKERIQIY
jgi:hypothetical protein